MVLKRLFLSVGLSLCFPALAEAQDKQTKSSVSLVVQTTTNWVYRGLSETRDRPSLGLNLEWQPTDTLFLGVEAHQATVSAERQRERSFSAYIGASQSLTDQWFGSVALQHFEFPGSTGQWDFTELQIELHHDNGINIELGYSPDYYDQGTSAAVAELGYTRRLGERGYWYTQGGHFQSFENDELPDYFFARTGFGISKGAFVADASYHWVSESSADFFSVEPLESPGFVLQLSYRIR